jgi:hypothetical protein
MGTILFVHGTGVRSPDYQPSFQNAAKRAVEEKIPHTFIPCPWGDVFGARFSPKSLPRDEFTEQLEQEEEDDLAQWSYLFADPLFELRALTIPEQIAPPKDPAVKGGANAYAGLSAPAKYQQVWTRIQAYQPTPEFQGLLRREHLIDYWPRAFQSIVSDPVTAQAFKVTGDQTPVSADALARAIVAQMMILAEHKGAAGPGRDGRKELVDRLKRDWDQAVFGVTSFLTDLFAKPATYVLKQRRSQWSRAITNPIGDILLYQSHGDEIRDYLITKMANLPAPVILMAHSLGGIACVDLLVSAKVKADRLITFGSQSPFLYEMGALESLKPPDKLPPHFPPWLNFYDQNDFLSYLAAPVFGESDKLHDVEIRTGRPFPASHSAYLSSPKLWNTVRDFVRQ